METLYDYLGLAHISGREAVIYVGGLAGIAVSWVLWHARRRLKLSKKAIEETDFPGYN